MILFLLLLVVAFGIVALYATGNTGLFSCQQGSWELQLGGQPGRTAA